MLHSLSRDVIYAVRILRRHPASTLTAILTLALGIGLNTAVFSVVSGVLWRDLPFPESERLVQLFDRVENPPQETAATTAALVTQARNEARSFERVAAGTFRSAVVVEPGDPKLLSRMAVTEGFFDVLGVRPAAGRFFTAEDYAALSPGDPDVRPIAEPAVTVISYNLWQQWFGARPDIVGLEIRLVGGAVVEIVGVAPPEMRSVRELAIEAWIPAAPNTTDPEDAVFASFGRLAAGASIDDARAELAVISARLAATNPDVRGRSTSAAPLLETVVQDVQTELRFLFATVLVILLVTCVNLVNLFLTHASGRRIELTTRVALGATRAHLVRQTVTEALVVAGAGGAAGLLLAFWALPLLVAMAPATVPRLTDITIDWSVLAFAALVSAGVGLTCGIAACLPFDIRNVAAVLGRARATAPFATNRFRRGLTVAEVGLSLMLLIAAALMVRTVRQVAALDLGFNSSNVVAASLGSGRAMTLAETRAFQTTIVDEVRSLPSVTAAGIGLGPLRGGMGLGGAAVPGDPRDFGILRVDSVSAGYFEALGARLVAGRFFVPDDARDPRRYVIVNEAAARLLWGVADPIGKVLIKNIKANEQLTVVGVVANMRTAVLEVKPEPTLYFFYTQDQNFSANTMLVRADGDAERLVPAIRGIIRRVDPERPFGGVEPLQRRIDRELAPRVFVLRAVGLFSLLSVLLAIVGIYGVVAESVAQRVPEIGVRLALGAGAPDILRLILGQGARMIAAGVVLGLAGAFALRGVMTTFVFGIETIDPLSYAAACALLVSTTLAACALPARRAARLDPATAIRD